MKRLLPFITFILSATLAACGGGGSSDGPSETKSIVDPYVGTWAGCLQTSANESQYATLEFTKQSGLVLAFEAHPTSYSNSATCAGTGVIDTVQWGTFTFDGTTKMVFDPVSSTTVMADKLLMQGTQPAFGPLAQVARIEGGTKLVLGLHDGVDAQGYPEALRTSAYLKR